MFGDLIRDDRKSIETATDHQGKLVLAKVKPKSVKTGFSIAIDETNLAAEVVEIENKTLCKFDNALRNEVIVKSWRKDISGRTLVFAINIWVNPEFIWLQIKRGKSFLEIGGL